ncbi:hypothetical protein [Rhodovulum sulfidophilum]|uniref:Uncharacterized protein n=1 Tax=Rhodovulum sulfidophilum TaxID=35806 RepID=A0ABS1RTD0_RHOSU|nr:hypothetical protein [Rhodovulum sulfidophilum]MBL3608782.1 hypothetical protein [Rhodovulum sulfidophilum]MCE8458951.1 hypothetical protein [Rhodovulum sulfidophilum]
MARLPLCLAAAVLPMLAACAEFPEIDAAERAASGPTLVPEIAPIDPLLARAHSLRDSSASPDSLESRAARLRARAARLRARDI